MSAPIEVWGVADIANALGISRRRCEDILRDPDCPTVPFFGRMGNSRMYDPGAVRLALPKLRAFIDGATERSHTKRLATLAAQEDLIALRQEAVQAELQRGREQKAHFRSCEAEHAAADAAEEAKQRNRQAIIATGR